MRPIVRRTACVLAVPALALSTLGVLSSPASAAPDPAPATAGGAWLAAQVPDDGLFSGQFGSDYGLSIDVALGLTEAEAGAAEVTRIRDAVASDVDSYISYSYEDGGVTHTGETGGATAKALVLAQRTGGTPTDFGGVDLVDRLESLIDEDGRVISTFDGAPDPSYDNTYIQTLAVTGLAGTGSASRTSALGYLLDQQCADGGYFRGDIPEGSTDACADDPDTDSTAQAVLALEDGSERTAAVDWLLATQKANGSFGGGVGTEAPNANSTGLAALALTAAGESDAAAKAAAWLRAHQATNVAGCDYHAAADTGAIVYDDAARTQAQSGPMSAALRDQSVRATAQALPGLLAAQAGAGDPHALFTAEYVRAGGTKSVGVVDAAPGEALCATLGAQSVLGYADANGEAHLKVTIPGTTRTSRVTVASAGGTDTVEIKALGKKTLRVSAKAKVAKGTQQNVKVTGLAPHEHVTVKLLGRTRSGQATKKGVFSASAKVTAKPGRSKVVVTGQFGNRRASKTFTIKR